MSGAAYLALGNLSHAGRGDESPQSAGQGAMYILRLGRYAHEPDRLLASEEGNLPAWATDAVDYFRASDEFLLRKNGRVAQQLTLALPVELEPDEHITLVREYMHAVLGDEALPYTWAYHAGYGTNPHVHVLISEAINDGIERPREQWFRRANSKAPERGGAPKSNRFRAKSVPAQLRGAWEEHANRALARAELDVRIDMRSYKRRGLELRPQVKQGRDLATALDGHDGRLSMVAAATAQNVQRALQNAQRIEDKPDLLLELYRHQRTITRDQLEREIQGRCQLDHEQPSRIREALTPRLTRLGTDRRGNEQFATLEQLHAAPELAIRALTLTRSTFTERELAALFGDSAEGRQALARALAHPDLVSLGAVPVPGAHGQDLAQERFTARELLAAEQRLGHSAHLLASSSGPRLSSRDVEQAAERLTLDRDGGDEQRRMLEALAGSADTSSGLVLVQGRPGTGKSYVVRALQEVAQPAGVRVLGAAIAGKAAAALGADAGIDTFTVAKLISDIEAGRLDVRAAILVVDEAGMVDTRSLDRLLHVARAAGVGRVALIGDTQQLAPVGAGTPFARLQRAYPVVLLENIKRQRVEWQRDASRQMSTGKPEDVRAALNAYAQRRCVHGHASTSQAQSALVDRWLTTRLSAPSESTLVLAHRREDVAALNTLMREALRSRGLLGTDHTFLDQHGRPHQFAVGDQLLFTKRDAELGTRNGTAGRLLAVRGGALHIRLDDGRTVAVDAQRHAAQLEHGFAMTVHRAQGATVDHTFVYASATFTAETTFVALTRHRESAAVYFDQSEFRAARPSNGALDVDTPAEVRLFTAISRSQEDLSATDALNAAVRGRPTDAEVHVRRFRNAPNDEAREALRRQLEALAYAPTTPADALAQHPAVVAARTSYVAAQHHADRVAARCRARQAHLAANAPRSLRFKAQLDHAQRSAEAAQEIQAALAHAHAQVAHAEATFQAVLAHPDVRNAAAAVHSLQNARAAQARRALELVEGDARSLRPLEALHDYGLAENNRLGRPLYRAATTADRGEDQHHRLLEFVKVDQQSLAVLEASDGRRLLFPVTEKAARWLAPGDYVRLSEKGPWLEKRNRARAHAEIRADLQGRGVNDSSQYTPATPLPLELRAVVELPSGVRYGLGCAGEADQWVDLSHLPHAAALQAGDQVRFVQPEATEGADRSAPRLVRVHAAALDQAVAAQHARLTDLRAELGRLAEIVPPTAASMKLLPEGAAALERLEAARAELRDALHALSRSAPESPAETRGQLEQRVTQAETELQAARTAALALRQQGDVRMELSRQQGEHRIAQELAAIRREQLERDLPVLERDLAARSLALELQRSGARARLLLESDRGSRFIFERSVQKDSQHLAVLLAADGSSVVMPVTGHEKAMALLQPGQLVSLDRGARHLFPVTPKDRDQLEREAERLRAMVERPRLEAADVLREHPHARELAERVLDTRAALRAADIPGARSPTPSAARTAHRRAKGELEQLLSVQPELQAAARQHLDAARAEWTQARTELGKLEARLSSPERAALSLRIQHALNAQRGLGEVLVRDARPGDTGFAFERLESRGNIHVAVLRNGLGSRITHDVTFDPLFRQKALPGTAVLVAEGDRGLRLTLDPSAQRAAAALVLEQVAREKGPVRLWEEADRSSRFVFLGARHTGAARIALLAAESGVTVARDLTLKDHELTVGDLVSENARTGALEQHARPYYAKLEERASSLRARVGEPAFTLEHAYAELPETRAAALRVLEALSRAEAARLQPAPETTALAERELHAARGLLNQVAACTPGAAQRAEEVRAARGREWHEAARELGRVERLLDARTAEAHERLFLHEHNRQLPPEASRARSMREEDRECTFERFEHRADVHIAVLRTSGGERVTTPVRDPSVRELAQPGMSFALEKSGPGRSLIPTNPADRAAQRALERGPNRSAPRRTRGDR